MGDDRKRRRRKRNGPLVWRPIWFRRREGRLNWRPVAWQAWVVMAVCFLLVYASLKSGWNPTVTIVGVLGSLGLMFGIIFMTADEPE